MNEQDTDDVAMIYMEDLIATMIMMMRKRLDTGFDFG